MAVVDLVPTADDSVAFTPLGGGTNFSEVDDGESHDSDTSYNQTTDGTSTDFDDFTFADASIPTGSTINSVILRLYARDTGGGPANLNERVTHDALNQNASHGLGTSYALFTYDVSGVEGWEAADFDGQAIKIGYRVQGNNGTRERRVTAVHLRVDYTPPSDMIPPGSLAMMNAGT